MKTYAFPGIIDSDILKIGAEQIPYMRTKEFGDMNKESEELLLKFIGCAGGRTIIYTGSGTGAMSAVVENYVSTKNKAIVIDGGTFGHRWSQLCDYYGCHHVDIVLEFGKDIDYDELEAKISEERPDVLLCQHHETSSGQLYDLFRLSTVCQRFGVSLVVDVVSSFLAEELDMNKLGIDICITSTQKGLNIPPGLSIIFLNKRLNDYQFHNNGFYWDFSENLRNLTRGQTPYSPATTLYMMLNKRLHQIESQGVASVINKVHERAHFFRTLCKRYSWNIVASNPSYAISGFDVNRNGDIIFRKMIEMYNTFIMPGSKPGFFRVSHMGIQSEDDLRTLAEQIHSIERL